MARIKIPLSVLPISIAVIVFIIGFFWVRPGFLDLGGDSSRLYFYDPINYLKGQSLYSVSPSGLGGENSSYYGISFFLFLGFLKYLLGSSSILVSVFYGASISLAFVFVYLSVREIIGFQNDHKQEIFRILASCIGGLYYIFSPTPILNWGHNISTYNQVFLNPMMFYLLLKFLLTKRRVYMGIAIVLTLIFSPNFSVVGAPPILSFYPLAFLYMYIYVRVIRQQSIPWREVWVGFFILIGLHMFQILPMMMGVFSSVNPVGNAIFSSAGRLDRGLGYFTGLTNSVKVTLAWLGLPQLVQVNPIGYLHVIFPAIILFGFLKNKGKSLLLTGVFFCIALFWETANITNIGASFYKSLFQIPGFAMFRNYYAQFTYVYLFFYVLLFSQALFVIFAHIHRRVVTVGVVFLSLLLVITAWPLINGSIVNSTLPASSVKTVFRMDPSYEKVLSFFRNVDPEGKVLLLPLTDYGYQVLAGQDAETAYMGPSTISYLTGKQDFAGLEELETWKDTILYLVKNKQYDQFKKIIGLLGVKYIFYNSDSGIYDHSFSSFPYTTVKQYFPADQLGYADFIKNMQLKEILNVNDKYFVYQLDEKDYFSEVYATTNSIYVDRKIADWITLLSFEISGLARPVIYEKMQPALAALQLVYQAVPKEDWTSFIKNQNPKLKLHNSYSTTSPKSLVYPLIMAKEEISLKNYYRNTTDEMYIDKRVLFSAKRVFELEKFGPSMNVLLSANNSSSLQSFFDSLGVGILEEKYINSWEWNLTRYNRYMQEGIARIKRSTEDKQWHTYQKFLVNEYLQQHRVRITKTLQGAQKSTAEVIYLSKMIEDMFSTLVHALEYPKLYTNEISYGVDLPKDGVGSYSVLMGNQMTKANDITLKNSLYTLHNTTQEKKYNTWYDMGVMEQNGQPRDAQSFQLIVDAPINLINSAESTTSAIIISLENSKMLDVESPFNGQAGIFWRVDDWLPNSYYLFSLEYKTNGGRFDIKIYDSQLEHLGNRKYTNLINDMVTSDSWTSYQGIVKSTLFTNSVLIGIVPSLEGDSNHRIEVKNISLVQMPILPILFKKNTPVSLEKEPQITVTKLNPTKYSVRVRASDWPYTLVLNEAYNKAWKVYQSDKDKKTTIFDAIFSKKHPIADTRHYQVNGYANGWQIVPSDINNTKDYELTIEMVSQKNFYISAIVSLLFLAVFIPWLVWTIWKKR